VVLGGLPTRDLREPAESDSVLGRTSKDGQRTTMALLRIDLQDGFEDDTVVVRTADGEEQRREHVTTVVQVGYAGSIDMIVQPGPVRLEVSVPSRRLSESITLEVSGDLYLGLSIAGPQITHRLSEEPMGYL
jgi:hypothetical protein